MQEIWFIKFFPKNVYLKACSASFPRAQSASFLISTLNSFQSMLKVSNGAPPAPTGSSRGRDLCPASAWLWGRSCSGLSEMSVENAAGTERSNGFQVRWPFTEDPPPAWSCPRAGVPGRELQGPDAWGFRSEASR